MANDTLPQQGLFVAADSGPYFEITRAGGHYNVILATAAAPIVAVPTTTALLEVWNNVSSPFTLEVTDLFIFQVLGTAALHAPAIWAMVTTQKAVPTLTALNLFSQSGRAPIVPTANGSVVTGVGTTVVANGWRPFGAAQGHVSTATPDSAGHVEVGGRLIVPPGCSVAITVTDTLATASSIHVGASFVLKQAISGAVNQQAGATAVSTPA